MKIVVLDAATLGPGIDLTPLETVGEVSVFDLTGPEQMAGRLAEAEVTVSNKIRLTERELKMAPNLKLVCVTATGFDTVDVGYCREHGIGVCNVPGYSTDSVAQLTLAMALELVTHLGAYRRFVDSGEYTRGGIANRLEPVWQELGSMTWGILGGGSIGLRVAELAQAFGCRVLVCSRSQKEGYENVDIETLFARSDIVSVHVPLNDATRGLVGPEQIAAMKKGAILINVARGAVCDEETLARAVEEGHLGGLGVDVFSREPFPESHPFYRILGRENVCLTPHMAWGSVEARNRCIALVAENIRHFRAGRKTNRVEGQNLSRSFVEIYKI